MPKSLLAELMNVADAEIGKLGFEKANKETYLRDCSNGFSHALIIRPIRKWGLALEPTVCIRQHELERLYNQFSERADATNTFTIRKNLGHLMPENTCLYPYFKSLEDTVILQGLIRDFQVYGIPYLKGLESLESMENAVKKEMDWSGAFDPRILVIYKLLGKSEESINLAEDWLSKVENLNTHYSQFAQSFTRNFIQSFSSEPLGNAQ
ncbi:MAG: hypothetical protein K2Y39_23915 [Candidatus Obscuribacterales bacterium]|jgi:hypothetical protein|nr:hypothetical protein [Candidatus Obscuribacterales bacterium]